jgi:4-hydroxy-4-methyl-2-oxoglutarate aldolase
VTLLARLRAVQVSSLCDADKTLPVVDPAIRALVDAGAVVGPAVTVRAPGDHLPVFAALAAAPAGSVLVVDTGGASVAVSGELFATEAVRRGIAGIVVDGYCRDLRGLRSLGLPVYARGTTPMAGTTVTLPSPDAEVTCGGVRVRPGDIVVGDADGLVIAAPDVLAAALPAAEEIERAEAALLAGMAAGRSLHEQTTVDEHLRALAAGERGGLAFLV